MKNKLLKTRTLGLAMAAVLATGSFSTASWAVVPASVNSNTATLQVTATIAASCSIATTPVSFGTIPTNGSSVYANGSVTVSCSNGTTAYVTLDEGVNPHVGSSPSNPFRQMKHSSAVDVQSYSLYSDGGNTVFGSNVGQQNTIITNGTVNVYGQAIYNNMESPRPGSYSDTVVATVTY